MPRHPGRFFIVSISLSILIFLSFSSSAAQAGFTAALSAPDISTFPHLTAYLDVHDPNGAFVHGLTTQDVSIQENNVQIPASELTERLNGVQFVVAISPGASLLIRDGLGVTRYEYLRQAMLAGTWVNQPVSLDDFSMLTVGGPMLVHSSNPADLGSMIESYMPDDPNAVPSLEVLASALQVAADPTARSGMERAVLFITPPQETDISLGLQSIIASAVQQNIRIYVWLVAAPEVFDLPEIDQLRKLAEQTQATFFAFSHEEPVPDLETLLEPLRYDYQIGYDSQITTGGQQQVAVQVTVNGETFTSPNQSFEINLQSPQPVLLAFPDKIVRAFPSQPTPGESNVDEDLVPSQQILKIQVTFPDGYNRQLSRSSLYVDGSLAVENVAPPFDQFAWDLRPYTQDSLHVLTVEVVDSLGLVGKTDETTLKIVVPNTTQSVMLVFSQKRTLLIGLVILISASILGLVLIVGGRIHPKPHPGQVEPAPGASAKAPHLGLRERMRLRKDPVTQPVKIASSVTVQTKPHSNSWKSRLLWFKQKEKPVSAIAYLIPLVGSEEVTLPMPLEIRSEAVTLGRDPVQSNLVIDDPAIEGLHAYLQQHGDSFVITDAGSVAGTWVNYELVPPQGILLKHADIIHLGKVGFRIKLSNPGEPEKIVVTPLDSE